RAVLRVLLVRLAPEPPAHGLLSLPRIGCGLTAGITGVLLLGHSGRMGEHDEAESHRGKSCPYRACCPLSVQGHPPRFRLEGWHCTEAARPATVCERRLAVLIPIEVWREAGG